MISNKAAAIKKVKDSVLDEQMSPKKPGAASSNKHQVSSENGAIFTLSEFNFPHAIALHDSALKAEPLISTYRKIYTLLNLEHHVDVGITIIVTPKWMFVATLTGPYTEFAGMPVYLDGYAYTGILNVQITEKVWPATAGISDRGDLLPFEILDKSSQYK